MASPGHHHHAHGPKEPVGYSFAAAGWLQIYHFGVAKALQEFRVDAHGSLRFAGSSAGALASAALILDTDFDELREYAVDCVNDCRSKWYGAFLIRKYVRDGIRRFATSAFAARLKQQETEQAAAAAAAAAVAEAAAKTSRPSGVDEDTGDVGINDDDVSSSTSSSSVPSGSSDEAEGEQQGHNLASPNRARGRTYATDDVKEDRRLSRQSASSIVTPSTMTPASQSRCYREQLNRRLEVYVSVLPWCREKAITQFDEVDDLEEALIASCCLTPLAGLPFQLRRTEEWVCDGGMTAFQPRKNHPGFITVSPMYFASADIKPKVFLPIWYGLYPPDEKTYRAIYDLGFNDALEFLIQTHRVSSKQYALHYRRRAFDNMRDPLADLHRQQKKRQRRSDRAWRKFGAIGGIITDAFDHVGKYALAISRDVFVGVLFLLLFRPVSIGAIYVEMFLLTSWSVVMAMWHLCVSALQAWWLVSSFGRPMPAVLRRLSGRVAPAAAAPAKEDGLHPSASGRGLAGGAYVSPHYHYDASAPEVGNADFFENRLPSWKAAKQRWGDVYDRVRNMISARVPLHLLLGAESVNQPRLEKHSRLYRVVKPFMGS